MFWFCYFARERKNFRWSLFKSQVSGLKGEACLQLQRSRLNQLCCQLEAFGRPGTALRFFFFSFLLSSFLPGSLWIHLQNQMKINPFYANLPGSNRTMFGHKSGGSCSESLHGDFSHPGLAMVHSTTYGWKGGSRAFRAQPIRQAFSKYSRLQ